MLVHDSPMETQRSTNSLDVRIPAGGAWIGPKGRETTPVTSWRDKTAAELMPAAGELS